MTESNGPCYCCQALLTYPFDPFNAEALRELLCDECGEDACATCRDCDETIPPHDLVDAEDTNPYTERKALYCQGCRDRFVEYNEREPEWEGTKAQKRAWATHNAER